MPPLHPHHGPSSHCQTKQPFESGLCGFGLDLRRVVDCVRLCPGSRFLSISTTAKAAQTTTVCRMSRHCAKGPTRQYYLCRCQWRSLRASSFGRTGRTGSARLRSRRNGTASESTALAIVRHYFAQSLPETRWQLSNAHGKVVVNLDHGQSMKKLTLARQRRDSIFCLVYTIDTFHAKIPAIRETWG
jgi:hypothetical protein